MTAPPMSGPGPGGTFGPIPELSPPPVATTGIDWRDGQFGIVDNRFYMRGPLACIAVRDNRGVSTNISPYISGTGGVPQQNWSPIAADGQLRKDLFADVQINGNWFINTQPNEGFWRIGAMEERNGPERKGAIRHDDQMILQSNFPFDTDLTGEGITITFTPLEALKPSMVRLRMNMPLADNAGYSLVEDVGQPNYAMSKPVDATSLDRQILAIFLRKRPGGYIISVEGYPLVKMTDIGAMKRSKTDPDAPSLTFTALPSPFHTDMDYTVDPAVAQVIPTFYSQWIGGTAWATLYEHGS